MTEAPITLEEIDEHEAYAKQEIERFGAGGLVELDPRELLRLCATARRGVEAGAEIAQIRDALTGDDYASLPSDLPTVRMAHEIRADHDKFRNQVRDTCRRAETAEAALAEAAKERTHLAETHEDAIKDLMADHKRILAEAVRRERETCAGYAENHDLGTPDGHDIARAIRARPTEPAASPAAPIGEQ